MQFAMLKHNVDRFVDPCMGLPLFLQHSSFLRETILLQLPLLVAKADQ